MKSLLIVSAAFFIGFTVHANESTEELNLSDNYSAITLTEMSDYIEKGANIVAEWGINTYRSTKALAKKYGPTMWSGVVEYGPALVKFFLDNQEKIFSAADGIQKYLAKDAPKEAPLMITDQSQNGG